MMSMRKLAGCGLLCLLVLSSVSLVRPDGDADGGSDAALKAEIRQLKGEVQSLKSSLSEATTEKQVVSARISTLEQQVKDAESIAEAKKKELDAQEKQQQAASTLLRDQFEAAEKRALDEAAVRQQKEEQLKKASLDLQAAKDKLKLTESKLEKEVSVVDQLVKELPPLPNQSGAVDEAKKGQMLLERVKHTVKHQGALAKEVEQLRASLGLAEQRLLDSEAEKGKLGRSASELRKLEKRVQELETEALRHKKTMEEVTKQWLPPWFTETLESAQEQAQHHWEHTAKPTIKLVRSQSLDAMESAKKQAEPHVQSFVKASREFAQSTRDAMRPHLDVAMERHKEAMSWLSQQSAELSKAAEPHVKKGLEAVNVGLGKVHEAASPYIKQASAVVRPYYEEVYAAAKPGLETMRATALQYWRSASQALGPQLELLAEQSKAYQRQMSGMMGNVTQQVAKGEVSTDVLLFAEIGMYLVAMVLAVILLVSILRLFLGSSKDKDKKAKGGKVPGSAGKKQAHNSSHGHHSSGSHHTHQHKKQHK